MPQSLAHFQSFSELAGETKNSSSLAPILPTIATREHTMKKDHLELTEGKM
jgi:hypothetical protein